MLSWWPFGTNHAQVIVAGFSIPAVIAAVVVPMSLWGLGPWYAWAMLTLAFATASALAVRGVALDRRGDGRGGRGWLSFLDRVEQVAEVVTGVRSRFASPARAQLWYEWRTKALAVVLFVAALGFVTALFF